MTHDPLETSEQMPLSELKTALSGFITEITGFHSDLNSKLHKHEERLNMIDRKSMTLSRPALAKTAETLAPHQKAFDTYLRSGDDEALRGLELDAKAMSTSVASDGGYLVDPQTSDTIATVLRSHASLRAICNVVNVEATSYDLLIDQGEFGSGWVAENGTVSETGTTMIERISIPLFELSALPKASQRLLDDSAFDIETWLAGRVADKFARDEGAAFVMGDGNNKPTGFLSHGTIDNMLWSWGSLGYVATGTSADIGDGVSLIDLVYTLGAEYRANGSFVMNSKTAGSVRKLKDADGRFLWSDSLAAGEPARLLGYPVHIVEDMPDIAADRMSIAFGDFSKGYTVVERPDIRILRDPFSAKPHVLFYATKRVGGDISDFAAIKLLKFGTS